jgi:hypothetical protein
LCLKLHFHTKAERSRNCFFVSVSRTKAKRSGDEGRRFLDFWSLDGAHGTRFQRNLAKAAGFRGEETSFFSMFQYNHPQGYNLTKFWAYCVDIKGLSQLT